MRFRSFEGEQPDSLLNRLGGARKMPLPSSVRVGSIALISATTGVTGDGAMHFCSAKRFTVWGFRRGDSAERLTYFDLEDHDILFPKCRLPLGRQEGAVGAGLFFVRFGGRAVKVLPAATVISQGVGSAYFDMLWAGGCDKLAGSLGHESPKQLLEATARPLEFSDPSWRWAEDVERLHNKLKRTSPREVVRAQGGSGKLLLN